MINVADFIGEKVEHLGIGDGTIVEFDPEERYIFVAFNDNKTRQFPFPKAFLDYLIPIGEKITKYVHEHYGTHQCYHCGIIVTDAEKDYCERCEKAIVKCELCGNISFSPKIHIQENGEVIVCDFCYDGILSTKKEFPISQESYREAGLKDIDYFDLIDYCDQLRSVYICKSRFSELSNTEYEKRILSDIAQFFHKHFAIECNELTDRSFRIIVFPENAPLYEYQAEIEKVVCRICHNKGEKWPFNQYKTEFLSNGREYYKVPFIHISNKTEYLQCELEKLEEESNYCRSNSFVFMESQKKDYLEQLLESIDTIRREIMLRKYKKEQDELDRKIMSETVFVPEKNTLYIHFGNNIKCKRDHHRIQCFNAFVPTINNGRVKINVNYCLDCKKFFISNDSYQWYIKNYKVILVRFAFVSENGEYVDFYQTDKAAASPLALCGYTVSQKVGYSAYERHEILSRIINMGIQRKWQVIDLLMYFIDYNGRKPGNSVAVSKWEDDLKFVYHFDEDKQQNVEIDNIQKY